MKSQDPSINVRTIVSETIYQSNQINHKLDHLNLIPITNNEMREIFTDNESFEHITILLGDRLLSQNQENHFAKLIKEKLDGYEPDITYSIYVLPMIKDIFPNALCLRTESALFSRPPFMRTIFFTNHDSISTSFLSEHAHEIRNFQITKEQENIIINFKKQLIQLIEDRSPIKNEIEKVKRKFKKLILFPLTYIGEEEDDTYANELDYFFKIMDTIPSDIGVIVTQHDQFQSLLTSELLPSIKSKYPNFIFFENLNNFKVGSSSLFFFNHVDAIIAFHSTVGAQSLIWDIRIISTFKDYHDWCKDADIIEDMTEILEKAYTPKHNILYWYLTHYTVFSRRFTNGEWLYNYFSTKLDKFRKDGMTFDYYTQQEDIEELTNYILQYVSSYDHPTFPKKNIAIKN